MLGASNAGMASAVQYPRFIFDFPRTLVGHGLQGWHRCDSIVTDGMTIEQIDDQSGNGRHAVQAVTLLQPDVDDVNFARRAAAFGGGPYLTIPADLAAAMPADNWTMWVVGQAADDSTDMGIFSIGSSGGASMDVEAGNWTVRAKGIGLAVDGAADTANLHLFAITRASGTMRLYIDGAEVVLDAPTIAVVAPSGASSIGSVALAVFVWIGWFLESGAVSRVLTPAELAALYAYYTLYYTP